MAEIAIIAATSYITICMTNTALYKEIAHNLSTNIGDFLGGTIGVVLTFISTIFLFLTFKFQQSQYKETKDDAFRAISLYNAVLVIHIVMYEVAAIIAISANIYAKHFKNLIIVTFYFFTRYDRITFASFKRLL